TAGPKSAMLAETRPQAIDAAVERKEAAPPGAVDAAQHQNRGAASDSSIRVDVVLLDKLMNLVGELVLARNQILQLSSVLKHAGFAGKFHPCLTARETLSPLASLLL